MKVVFSVDPRSKPIEVEFKDWRGTPIDVGSKIVYATGSSSPVGIVEGEVISITPVTDGYRIVGAEMADATMRDEGYSQEAYDRMFYNLQLCFKLKVKRIRKPGGWSSWNEPKRDVTITEVDRVTVIE